MDLPITFGEWLHQSRSELRLTCEEFARCVGCSVSALRKIENGERRPSDQIAGLMAICLEIPPAERATFVKVARSELSVDRLLPISTKLTRPGAAPVAADLRSHLPVLPTPLIGRQREVAELCQLLHDPLCCLLTLVGPGGIGKTRLQPMPFDYLHRSRCPSYSAGRAQSRLPSRHNQANCVHLHVRRGLARYRRRVPQLLPHRLYLPPG